MAKALLVGTLLLAASVAMAAPAEDPETADAPTPPLCPEPGTSDVPLENCTPPEEQEIQKKDEEERKGLEGIGLPLVSYNTDLGFGFGGVGGAYYYSPGYYPYRYAIAAQVFFTTKGVRNHWIRFDGPSLIGNARLELRLEYRRELIAPFYGIGNLSAPEFVPGVTPEQPFSFDLLAPGGWVRLRTAPLGEGHPFTAFLGYGYQRLRIREGENTVLAQTRPLGIAGGNHGQILVGLIWDTRDDEADPSTGGFSEIALRLAGEPTGSDYSYSAITVTERRFFSLAQNVIFAQRLTLDAAFGEVPFFVMSQFGGTIGGEGIGGMSSVRGVPRNRYVGNIKVLSNSELRFYAFDFPLFGEPVKVGGVSFVDVGRVWHPDVADGSFWAWHPGVGVGLRLVRRAAVARFDYAVSTEQWRQAIYLSFGHMF